jgi:flagellar hook-associated protein 2
MASSINFSGLGSNIDFSLIRDAVVAQRMQPVTQLQTRSTSLTNRAGSLKALNGLLANLTAATSALTDRTLGTGRSADSSDSSVVTGTATTAASLGTFNLTVDRLATKLTQASQSFLSKTDPVLAGVATTATFELRLGGAATGPPITIDSTNNTLEGLRDAINAAPNAGVTASIVDISGDGTQNQLVLSSTATGTAGRVELVETTATGTGAALNIRSLNPPGAVADFSALNSQFSLNGLSLTRSSNSISDAVTGVTFNLQKAGTASIGVSPGLDIADKLQDFVSAYNSVQKVISTQYTLDGDGKPTGILAGDPTLRMVQHQMRDSLSSFSTGNGGTLTSLADLGMGRDENDQLTLNTTVLSSKLQSNPDDVKALLFGTTEGTGLFNSIHGAFDNLSDTITGSVQTAINGYQTSIKSMDKSILDQTARISVLKATLTRQYAAVDAAIGQLNSQGSTLTSVIASLTAKSN